MLSRVRVQPHGVLPQTHVLSAETWVLAGVPVPLRGERCDCPAAQRCPGASLVLPSALFPALLHSNASCSGQGSGGPGEQAWAMGCEEGPPELRRGPGVAFPWVWTRLREIVTSSPAPPLPPFLRDSPSQTDAQHPPPLPDTLTPPFPPPNFNQSGWGYEDVLSLLITIDCQLDPHLCNLCPSAISGYLQATSFSCGAPGGH